MVLLQCSFGSVHLGPKKGNRKVLTHMEYLEPLLKKFSHLFFKILFELITLDMDLKSNNIQSRAVVL